MRRIKSIVFLPIGCDCKGLALGIFVSGLLANLVAFLVAIIQKYLINSLVKHEEKAVYHILLVLFILIVLALVISVISNCLSSYYKQKSALCLKNRILAKLFRIYYDDVEKNNIDYLHNRITSDATAIANFSEQVLLEIVSQIILLILSIIYIYIYCKMLLIIIFVFVFVLLLAYILLNKKMIQANSEYKESDNLLYASFNESLHNIPRIQTNQLEEKENVKQRKNIRLYLNKYMNVIAYTSFFLSIASSVHIILTLFVLLISSSMIIRNRLTVGDLVTLLSVVTYVVNPLFKIISLLSSFPEVEVSYRRIEEILEQKEKKTGNTSIENINKLLVELYSYKYENSKIDYDLKCEFYRGKVYFIKGENGAGKSTLLKIIARLYSKYEGKIIINDKVLMEDIEISSYYKMLSYLQQNVHLSSGTIRDNILCTEYELSAKKSLCCEFMKSLEDLPNGLKTYIIDNNGTALSGGERQKIAILNSVLKPSDVLLLDEPTNSLDEESIVQFYRMIKKIKEDRIVIIVTHSDKYDRFADEIVYIK